MIWRRARNSIIVTTVVGLAFLAWTLAWPSLADNLDPLWSWSPPSPESVWGQISFAIAMAFSPAVIYALLVIAAVWAGKRRLNNLAAAIVMASILTWSATTTIKAMIGRDRPESLWDFTITSMGYSYPSGHSSAITTAAILMVALTSTTGKGRGTVLAWRIAGVIAVALVATNRLVLHSHYVTDVIGGVLLGSLATSITLLLCDVHILTGEKSKSDRGKAAIIYNPTKIPDPTTFMRLVNSAAEDGGWEPPVWLATSPTDPGYAMAHTALESEMDLVIIAGGDGTVRIVLGELANTDTTVAIVPAGTGNLLARNLDIPLDYAHAVELLRDGKPTKLDLVRYTDDDDHKEYSAVLAGVGADAALMNDTDENLKKQIGPLAYVAAGLQHVNADSLKATLILDDGEPEELEAMVVSIGNVGDITGGISVMPAASGADGKMDVLIASPQNAAEMAQMAAAIVNETDVPSLTRHTCKKLELKLSEETLFQIDGDVIGETSTIKAEVMPHAVKILVAPETIDDAEGH